MRTLREILRPLNEKMPKCPTCGKPAGHLRMVGADGRLRSRDDEGICSCGPDPLSELSGRDLHAESARADSELFDVPIRESDAMPDDEIALIGNEQVEARITGIGEADRRATE